MVGGRWGEGGRGLRANNAIRFSVVVFNIFGIIKSNTRKIPFLKKKCGDRLRC